jgi:hypothetical protein
VAEAAATRQRVVDVERMRRGRSTSGSEASGRMITRKGREKKIWKYEMERA